MLRNGWYSENYTASAKASVEQDAVFGSAKQGRLSTAAGADYAEAAAIVIQSDDQAGRVYELAGDAAFTLDEYASFLSAASGEKVVYNDMPQGEFSSVLTSIGLPQGLAEVLADSDVGASKGGLFDDQRALSALIGHPTTPIQDSIREALT